MLEAKAGLTSMADRLGVSRRTLRCMELGVHAFTLAEVRNIARVIGLNEAELLGLTTA